MFPVPNKGAIAALAGILLLLAAIFGYRWYAADLDRQEAEIALTGTRGTIVTGIRAGRPYLSVRDSAGRSRTFAFLVDAFRRLRRAGKLGDLRRFGAPHTLLYADLLDALAEHRPPLADGAAGRAAVEAVLAVYRSSYEKRPVDLPGEDFPLEVMKGFFD